MGAFIAWINLEFWGPVWPNLAASVVTVAGGWLWARRRVLAELDRRDRIHAQHHAITHELVRTLHERLTMPMPPEDET